MTNKEYSRRVRRHGDVWLEPINSLPTGAKLVSKSGSYVLAYGEHTGHKHLLGGLAVTERQKNSNAKLEIYEYEGKTYLHVKGVAPLTHEEHKRLVVEPGFYVVEREQEFDYFLKSIRQVQD